MSDGYLSSTNIGIIPKNIWVKSGNPTLKNCIYTLNKSHLPRAWMWTWDTGSGSCIYTLNVISMLGDCIKLIGV